MSNIDINLNKRTLPVSLYRGDTANLICQIDLSNNPIAPTHYELLGNDKLYLGIIEPGKIFEDAIVKKIATAESSSLLRNKTVLVATGTIEVGSTECTVSFTGTYLSSYAIDSAGNKIVLDELVGESSVKFTSTSAMASVVECTVIYLYNNNASDPIIQLVSKDTEYLVPGKYYIQGKLYQEDEDTEESSVTTVIPTTILYIL